MPSAPPPQTRKRAYQLGALLLSTIAVVAVAIAVLGGTDTHELAPGKPVPGAVQTLALLRGISQQGIALGNPKAPVTLVEFGDLQCPLCAQFAQKALPVIVTRYVRTGRVRLEFRTLDSIGNDSLRAARMAGALGEQNHLWEFTDLMYDNQAAENSGYVTDTYLRALAGAIPGANVSSALSRRASAAVHAQIALAQRLAAQWHVRGTPAFLLERAGGPTEALSPASPTSASSFTGPLDHALADGRVSR